MAINITDYKLPITPQEARDFLALQTNAFGVFLDMDRILEIQAQILLENKRILRQLKRLSNNPKFVPRNSSEVIHTLNKMGVNMADFYPGKSKSASISKAVRQAILNNPAYSKQIHEFVEEYAKYSSNKHNNGTLESYLSKLPVSQALSKDNHRMLIARPTWSILNTSRIASSEPNVQAIPREMGDLVCEPKGYTLVRCDSGQIEPRINFSTYLKDDLIMNLINYYDDAYFGLLNFCEMKPDEEAACRANFKANFHPIEITDEIKAMRQNIKRLTNAGSYGSSNLDGVNPQLAAIYEKKLVNHPKRIALERDVRERVRHGEETFYGIFGTPVTPDNTTKYAKGDAGWTEHVVRCGINNPIQTTASELMMFSIAKAREVILNQAVDTHICFYKHDEACFYVSDEDMSRGIGDILGDITAYNVKGWIPIHADKLIGKKKGSYPSYII